MFLEWSLVELSKVLNGQLQGQSILVNQFSIDTRTMPEGACYIALRGENFDGHNFVAKAAELGAAAIIVEQEQITAIPQIIVGNTKDAMGNLAKLIRSKINQPLIGLTGSCGKTTVKSMISSILSQQAQVLATLGTQNNDIGVPLTLFRYQKDDEYVVLEMGMNHFGEIEYLNQIAKPDVVLINNARAVHLEGVQSVAGVAQAKGEILQNLKVNTVAVLPKDDEYYDYWVSLLDSHNHFKFSINSNDADVWASNCSLTAEATPKFTLNIGKQQTDIQLSVHGEHNVHNALAASAVCHALKIPIAQIKTGLENFQAVNGRMNIKSAVSGSTIIDDTYNANPDAVKSAIQLLMKQNKPQKWLVLSDMGELGTDAKQYHHQIGQYAKSLSVDRLFCVGELSQQTALGFGDNASHYPTKEALIKAIHPLLTKEICVLIKGSRSAQMESVVKALMSEITEKEQC